jgi:hypothetical protein
MPKSKDLVEKQWFTELIKDCQIICTGMSDIKKHYHETHQNAWLSETRDIAELRLQLGHRILSENDNFERADIYGEGIVDTIAKTIQLNWRIVYYSMEFARYVPSWGVFEKYIIKAYIGKYGKEPNWTNIVKIILPAIKSYMQKYRLTSLPMEDKNKNNINVALQEYVHDTQSQTVSPAVIHEKDEEKYDLSPDMEKDFRLCRQHLRSMISMITTGYIIASEKHKLIISRASEFLKDYPE